MHIRVLCVCKGNTCRSPMFAAAMRRRYAQLGNRKQIEVESAGYDEEAKGQRAAPEWFALQQKTGINLGSHVARWIGDLDLGSFDYIFCMDGLAADEVIKRDIPEATSVILVNPARGIENPCQRGIGAYRECYATICAAVERITC